MPRTKDHKVIFTDADREKILRARKPMYADFIVDVVTQFTHTNIAVVEIPESIINDSIRKDKLRKAIWMNLKNNHGTAVKVNQGKFVDGGVEKTVFRVTKKPK